MKLRDFDGRADLFNRSSVSVAGRIMVTELLSPSRKKVPRRQKKSPLYQSEYKRLTRLQSVPIALLSRLACDGDLSSI